jgi:hypothetical protein
MTSPQQQQEFEAAIQQHIQEAVAAALAGLGLGLGSKASRLQIFFCC